MANAEFYPLETSEQDEQERELLLAGPRLAQDISPDKRLSKQIAAIFTAKHVDRDEIKAQELATECREYLEVTEGQEFSRITPRQRKGAAALIALVIPDMEETEYPRGPLDNRGNL